MYGIYCTEARVYTCSWLSTYISTHCVGVFDTLFSLLLYSLLYVLVYGHMSVQCTLYVCMYTYFVLNSFSWKKFDISIRKLCSGDWDRTIQITVWDWNKLVSMQIVLLHGSIRAHNIWWGHVTFSHMIIRCVEKDVMCCKQILHSSAWLWFL